MHQLDGADPAANVALGQFFAPVGAVKHCGEPLQSSTKRIGIVDSFKDLSVIPQYVEARPLGLVIDPGGALVALARRRGVVVDVQAAFAREPTRELRVRQRVKQADHSDRNIRLLNKIDHWLRDRSLFRVEADNEAGRNRHAGAVNLVNTIADAAACILLLARCGERLLVRTFNADENSEEVAAPEHFQQFLIVRQIERSLGRELEWIIVFLDPIFERGQESLDGFLIADQIVVDEIDMAAVAEPVKSFQLGEHLRMGFGSRRAAIELDDVAELAREWATARELHADIEILVEFQKVVARNWRFGHIDLEFRRLKSTLALPLLPGRDEFVEDAFSLANHAEIRSRVAVRA